MSAAEGAYEVRMFVNGQAMRGSVLHDALAGATFLGAVTTSAAYRFFSVRDEFPGLHFSPDDPVARGGGIAGELYGLTYDRLRTELLPREPAELELGVVQLADGSGTLSMVMRESALGGAEIVDITAHRGWRAYLER